MIKLMTLVMVLSMPLTALATDAINKKLALRCTESLFFKGAHDYLQRLGAAKTSFLESITDT
jgi:hypothetical protein